jgi:hypothetical protein
MKAKQLIAALALLLALTATPSVRAQNTPQDAPSARQQLQSIHSSQSIDQELARLTKDLDLSAGQQKQIRALLQQHHDKTQALLDQNPTASRESLTPQIHAISDETHHQIHALLNDHQKELETKMQQRENNGEEDRHPSPAPEATQPPSAS